MQSSPENPRKLVVFGGSASRHLSREVCRILDIEEGTLEVSRFADGETAVKINNNVRGAETCIIQSTCTPVNDNMIELCLTIDALKRASADQINVIIPYFGYARQDRKDQGRVALSAKVMANLLEVSGATRVITIDLHAPQIQGFFDVPVDHLLALPVFVDYLKANDLDKDLVVVSPDVGNVKRARNYAARLEAPLAIIDKRRPQANISEVMNIIGDVEDKRCFMFDDMIDTAGTICNGAKALMERGAKEVYACGSHALLSGPAIQRLRDSPIKEVIVSDSIPHKDIEPLDKLKTVSIAPLIAEAVRRIHCHLSVSALFD